MGLTQLNERLYSWVTLVMQVVIEEKRRPELQKSFAMNWDLLAEYGIIIAWHASIGEEN